MCSKCIFILENLSPKNQNQLARLLFELGRDCLSQLRYLFSGLSSFLNRLSVQNLSLHICVSVFFEFTLEIKLNSILTLKDEPLTWQSSSTCTSIWRVGILILKLIIFERNYSFACQNNNLKCIFLSRSERTLIEDVL